jgi:hypothetical protein
MDKSSISYVGLDVQKESIDIETADAGGDGELRRFGSIGGDLVALDKALRKLISNALALDTQRVSCAEPVEESARTGRPAGGSDRTTPPQPFPATFTGNNLCTSGCSTFLSVPIAKKCSSTPSHGPKRFTS